MALSIVHETWHLKASCRGPESTLFFPPSVAERREEREAPRGEGQGHLRGVHRATGVPRLRVARARTARHLGRPHRSRTSPPPPRRLTRRPALRLAARCGARAALAGVSAVLRRRRSAGEMSDTPRAEWVQPMKSTTPKIPASTSSGRGSGGPSARTGNPKIAAAPRDPFGVHAIDERQHVLARRAEEVADVGDGDRLRVRRRAVRSRRAPRSSALVANTTPSRSTIAPARTSARTTRR